VRYGPAMPDRFPEITSVEEFMRLREDPAERDRSAWAAMPLPVWDGLVREHPVLYSPHLEECRHFYENLGLHSATEQDGQGPAPYVAHQRSTDGLVADTAAYPYIDGSHADHHAGRSRFQEPHQTVSQTIIARDTVCRTT